MKTVSFLGLHPSLLPRLKQAESFLLSHAFPFDPPPPPLPPATSTAEFGVLNLPERVGFPPKEMKTDAENSELGSQATSLLPREDPSSSGIQLYSCEKHRMMSGSQLWSNKAKGNQEKSWDTRPSFTFLIHSKAPDTHTLLFLYKPCPSLVHHIFSTSTTTLLCLPYPVLFWVPLC